MDNLSPVVTMVCGFCQKQIYSPSFDTPEGWIFVKEITKGENPLTGRKPDHPGQYVCDTCLKLIIDTAFEKI